MSKIGKVFIGQLQTVKWDDVVVVKYLFFIFINFALNYTLDEAQIIQQMKVQNCSSRFCVGRNRIGMYI